MDNGYYASATTSSKGSYYSPLVASANTAPTNKTSGVEFSYDICAKGWKMPPVSKFVSLVSSYNSNYSNFVSVWPQTYAGCSTPSGYAWTYGDFWWSSTTANGSSDYLANHRLYVYDNYILTGTGDSTYTYYVNRSSIRCLQK